MIYKINKYIYKEEERMSIMRMDFLCHSKVVRKPSFEEKKGIL